DVRCKRKLSEARDAVISKTLSPQRLSAVWVGNGTLCLVMRPVPTIETLMGSLEAVRQLPDDLPQKQWLIAMARRNIRYRLAPPPLCPICWPELRSFPDGRLLNPMPPPPPS